MPAWSNNLGPWMADASLKNGIAYCPMLGNPNCVRRDAKLI